MVMVEHRGGSSQRYSMVLVTDATLIPKADLTTFSNSILPSSTTPLVGDLVAISLAWHNQGTLASGAYRIQLEDITEGTILYDSNRSSLDGVNWTPSHSSPSLQPLVFTHFACHWIPATKLLKSTMACQVPITTFLRWTSK